MTNANIGKTSEVGRAELEHFDVEDAIREVRRLGRGLIEATRHARHRFREEWLEQLIERYRRLPGKPLIHLDGLGGLITTFSPQLISPEASIYVPSYHSQVTLSILHLYLGLSVSPFGLASPPRLSSIH